MQQNDGAAVGVALGRHIHIGHAELFALLGEGKQVDGIGIGKSFQRDAERLGGGDGLGGPVFGLGGAGRQEHDNTKTESTQGISQGRLSRCFSRVPGSKFGPNLNHRLAAQRWHPNRFANGGEADISLAAAPVRGRNLAFSNG